MWPVKQGWLEMVNKDGGWRGVLLESVLPSLTIRPQWAVIHTLAAHTHLPSSLYNICLNTGLSGNGGFIIFFCPLQLSVPMGLLTRGLKLLLLASAEKHKDMEVCMAQTCMVCWNNPSIPILEYTCVRTFGMLSLIAYFEMLNAPHVTKNAEPQNSKWSSWPKHNLNYILHNA